MHVVARVLAVAYLGLAVFAGVVYVQVVANRVNVTEVQEKIEGAVRVASVELHWSGNASEAARVTVNIEVRNPGKIAVEVIGVNYELHMDNLTDPRLWFDAGKIRDTTIQLYSVSYRQGQGIAIAPGATRMLSSDITVFPDTEPMNRLARPDGSGRYHPIVWAPWIVYTFVGLEVPGAQAFTGPYYDREGAVPLG